MKTIALCVCMTSSIVILFGCDLNSKYRSPLSSTQSTKNASMNYNDKNDAVLVSLSRTNYDQLVQKIQLEYPERIHKYGGVEAVANNPLLSDQYFAELDISISENSDLVLYDLNYLSSPQRIRPDIVRLHECFHVESTLSRVDGSPLPCRGIESQMTMSGSPFSFPTIEVFQKHNSSSFTITKNTRFVLPFNPFNTFSNIDILKLQPGEYRCSARISCASYPSGSKMVITSNPIKFNLTSEQLAQAFGN